MKRRGVRLMKQRAFRFCLSLVLIFSLVQPLSSYAASDKTTQYRVYQNTNLLQEFVSKEEAIQYAKKWANSYVEEIGTRTWVWHQFPKYEVYQLDRPLKKFFTLDDAIAEAKKWDHASVRQIEAGGWVWHNYPRYQLYQGEFTQESWKFSTLTEAQEEAKRWANAHVMDLETNKWIWDNISAEKKEENRQRDKVYKIYQGQYTKPEWEFASLEDAILEAQRWAHSYVINTAKNDIKVYENKTIYTVYQNSNELKSFKGLEEAITYAKKWANGKVYYEGKEIWTNANYYIVYQNNEKVKDFKTLAQAVDFAATVPKSIIKTLYDRTIWDSTLSLKVWAWTGSMSDDAVKNVVSNTRGLDVNSPTWFKLLDAEGNVEDRSSASLAKWLQDQDIEVHPLVHNQFDSSLTSAFLANANARETFIRTIVDRCAELGLEGINLDFEAMKGSDRDAYTQFVQEFATAAHEKGLELSIDLPRGSVNWNHLTAFDHEELANIVDHIVIMTYDQYYSGSTEAGSVAGLQWTENGVKEFLSYGIPREKLIMGIPFYIRQWKFDQNGQLVGNNAIYSYSVQSILEKYDVEKTWDDRFGQYRMEYEKDGFTYVFWLEDSETIQARLDIAKQYKLAGVSAWRLGQEDITFWDTIVAEK